MKKLCWVEVIQLYSNNLSYIALISSLNLLSSIASFFYWSDIWNLLNNLLGGSDKIVIKPGAEVGGKSLLNNSRINLLS